jgi:hypothetical protein
MQAVALAETPPPPQVACLLAALRLRSYVGQRITATGLMMNHEMQVRSLRPAGSVG